MYYIDMQGALHKFKQYQFLKLLFKHFSMTFASMLKASELSTYWSFWWQNKAAFARVSSIQWLSRFSLLKEELVFKSFPRMWQFLKGFVMPVNQSFTIMILSINFIHYIKKSVSENCNLPEAFLTFSTTTLSSTSSVDLALMVTCAPLIKNKCTLNVC